MDKFIFNGPGMCFGYIDTDDEETMKNITPQQLGLPVGTSREEMLHLMSLQQQKIENMPEAQKNLIKNMMRNMAAQIIDESNKKIK